MKLQKRLWGVVVGGGLILASYHDALLQFAVEARDKGLTWGLLVPVWIAVQRIYKGYRFNLRDLRWESNQNAGLHNQKVIMEALGVGDQWKSGQASGSPNTAPTNSKPLFSSLQPAINRAKARRRIKEMQISKAWIVSVLSYIAIEVIQKRYGVTVDEQWINWLAEGIQYGLFALAAYLNRKKIFGAPDKDDTKVYSMKKGEETHVDPQPYRPTGSDK